MKLAYQYFLKHLSFYFGGDQLPVSWAERLRTCVGSFIGLALVIAVAKMLGELSGIDEWFMASLGASALLVLALPASPMAQPWAVIGGNTVSGLVGITVAILIKEPLLALPLAASFSMLAMFMLRCLHPPAAAVALIAVLGGITHYRYTLFPLLIDSVLLVLAGTIYSNITGKMYPNRQN